MNASLGSEGWMVYIDCDSWFTVAVREFELLMRLTFGALFFAPEPKLLSAVTSPIAHVVVIAGG